MVFETMEKMISREHLFLTRKQTLICRRRVARWIGGISALCVSLFLILGAGPAHADRQAAAHYFSAGKQAFEKRDYLTAIRAFEESQRAKPHVLTLFALAQACRHQYERDRDISKIQQAIEHYSAFLSQAPRSSWRPMARAQLKRSRAILARNPPARLAAAKSTTKEAEPTQLMITTQAPGARVTIDGEPAGGEPAPAIRVVSEGKHRVQVEAPGYVASEREILAVKNQLVVFNVDLILMPGSLRVLSSEDGAAVFLDGQQVGVTPYEQVGVPLGTHEVKVLYRGHKLWSKKVAVRSGATEIALANLEQSPKRKISRYLAMGSLVAGGLGGLAGVFALAADSRIKQSERGTSTLVEWNDDRVNEDDRLAARDIWAITSTALFSVAAAAVVTAAVLYWFDIPSPPSQAKRPAGSKKQANGSWRYGIVF